MLILALLMDFLNTPEKRDRRLVHLPMGRFGEAIEQARAALFRKLSLSQVSQLDSDYSWSAANLIFPFSGSICSIFPFCCLLVS